MELSERLILEAEACERRATRLYQMASDCEELEAIRDGISHPAGCMYADLGDGEPIWYAVDGCTLDHSDSPGGLKLSEREQQCR